MSSDLERHLVRTLHEQVAHVGEPRGLAAAARSEALRLRRRRVSATAALVTAAVVAAAVALPLPGRDRADAPPADRVPEVSLSAAPEDRTTVSLGALPAGETPLVGWLDGDVFHHSAGYDVPIPIGVTVAVEHGPGVVVVREAGHPSLYLLSRTGETRLFVSGNSPVAGTEGRLAYVDHEQALLVVQGPDGASDWSRDVADPTRTHPVGFLPGGTVLVAVTRNGGEAERFEIVDSSGARRVQTPARLQLSDPSSGTVAGIETGSAGRPCVAIRPRPAARATWRACPPSGIAPPDSVTDLGPTGDWLVARTGQDRVAVLDLESGTVRRELVLADGATVGQVVAEAEEQVLLSVWQSGRAALVRCGLDGSCETAVSARQVSRSAWAAAPMAAR